MGGYFYLLGLGSSAEVPIYWPPIKMHYGIFAKGLSVQQEDVSLVVPETVNSILVNCQLIISSNYRMLSTQMCQCGQRDRSKV